MTRDKILNMPAGREMDALIAVNIVGLEKSIESGWWWINGMMEECPYYSTDILAAWNVVEKLMHDGFIWKSNGNESCGNLIYSFSFAKDDSGYEEYFKTYDSGITENLLPLAICRAALIAVMEAQ